MVLSSTILHCIINAKVERIIYFFYTETCINDTYASIFLLCSEKDDSFRLRQKTIEESHSPWYLVVSEVCFRNLPPQYHTLYRQHLTFYFYSFRLDKSATGQTDRQTDIKRRFSKWAVVSFASCYNSAGPFSGPLISPKKNVLFMK